ncbi:hypothetical protein GCM10022226_59720 [Sphaerisporangium flaviroseum]|uniref:AAA+ ATPase domain-containing protein n=1 Tax=Sphaerisporangium flaviroseum TaxID=509199 RepID=A0ABP7J0J9_9ACTN
MSSSIDGAVSRYRQWLLSELTSDDHGRLFPLRFKLARRSGHRVSRLSREPDGHNAFSFDELIASAAGAPIVVTGDPGSGKTTLLESFAQERLENGDPVFLLRMGLWSRHRPIVEQLAGRRLSAANATRVLRRGDCWVLFDALDEVRDHDIDAGFQAMLDFHALFPRCRIISSCRGAQLPAWAALRLHAATLQPLSPADVETALQEAARDSAMSELPLALRGELKELCRNPLVLSMTQELLLAGHDSVLQISSPSQIYDLFITLIDARERGRRPIDSAMERRFIGGGNLKLLGFVAWKMLEGMQASASEEQLAEWLEEALDDPRWSWFGSGESSPAELLAVLMTRAPLKQIPSPVGGHPQIGFMHLTFRDALAGRHLRLTMKTAGSHDALVEILLDERRRFWGPLTFVVGTEELAGRTSRLTVDVAFQHGRQELLVLAAQAVADRWDIDSGEIGDLSLSILEAFKNWDRPFDYELVRASRGLIQRLDQSYPVRLREDLVYFADKYAPVVPQAFVLTSVNALLALLDDERHDVVINALYTLASSAYRSDAQREEVALAIVLRLPGWGGDVADQAVAALKDLGAVSCLPTLRAVAQDAKSQPRSRAFAANGIAQMGDQGDLELLKGLLFDRRFRYRDSASWSLQLLARRILPHRPELRQEIVGIYLSALLSEPDDLPGRYAKGNILYSLGILKARERREAIESFILSEREAYVIEDGIYALGLLCDPGSEHILRGHLRHTDPAIRFKAGESLLALHRARRSDARLLRTDTYRIVCRMGEAIEARLTTAETTDLGMVAAMLHRGPVKTDSLREIFHIHSEQQDAVQRIFDRGLSSGLLRTRPRFLDHGSTHEVRISREDADALRHLCEKGSSEL